MINDALAQGSEVRDNTTTYRQIDTDFGGWECVAEDCDTTWCLNDGTPFENHMRYCPGCGRRIVGEREWTFDAEVTPDGR